MGSQLTDEVFNVSMTELILIITFGLLIAMFLFSSDLTQRNKVIEETSATVNEVSNNQIYSMNKLGLNSSEFIPEKRDLAESLKVLDNLTKELQENLVDKIDPALLNQLPLPDVWSKLSRLSNEEIDVIKLKNNIDTLTAKVKGLLKEKKILEHENKDKDKDLQSLAQHIKDYKMSNPPNKKLMKKNNHLISQMKNLQKRSKGLGFPPCWVDNKGKAEYTYKVIIHDSGMFVETIYPVYRKQDYIGIVGKNFNLNKIFDENSFNSIFKKFYKFGAQQNPACRFFVKVKDSTGEKSKSEWKLGLQAVENIFYKLIVQ